MTETAAALVDRLTAIVPDFPKPGILFRDVTPVFSDPVAFGRLVRACPAALYKVDAQGHQTFDHAGCLECGTCRIVGTGTVVARWQYPGPTMGVEYRYG